MTEIGFVRRRSGAASNRSCCSSRPAPATTGLRGPTAIACRRPRSSRCTTNPFRSCSRKRISRPAPRIRRHPYSKAVGDRARRGRPAKLLVRRIYDRPAGRADRSPSLDRKDIYRVSRARIAAVDGKLSVLARRRRRYEREVRRTRALGIVNIYDAGIRSAAAGRKAISGSRSTNEDHMTSWFRSNSTTIWSWVGLVPHRQLFSR